MNKPTLVNPKEIKIPKISLDMYTYQAFVGKKRVNNLTITEFNLLDCFLENAGTILSRENLFEHCDMNSFTGSVRSVDTHIQRLRSKLGKGGYLIKTVRGVGYRMEN